MLTDKIKQKARLSIIEKLKGNMPGPSVAPSPMTAEQMDSEAPEETLNDFGITDSLADKIKPKKKKKPGPETEQMDANEPSHVLGGY